MEADAGPPAPANDEYADLPEPTRPGFQWTGAGGMVQQQGSANDYNELVQEHAQQQDSAPASEPEAAQPDQYKMQSRREAAAAAREQEAAEQAQALVQEREQDHEMG